MKIINFKRKQASFFLVVIGLLFFCFICFSPNLHAALALALEQHAQSEKSTIVLDGSKLSRRLRPQLEYFIDEEGTINIDDVRSGRLDERFLPYPNSLKLQESSIYWLRFKLRNESYYSQSLVLDFNEILFWELDVYSRALSGVPVDYQLGLSRKEANPIDGRLYAFPVQVAAKAEQTVYSRIKTPYLIELNPYLFDPVSYASDSLMRGTTSNVILGMLMGIMLFLCVFVGYVRDSRDGVFYLAFVFLSALIVATCSGYITYFFPGYVWLNTHMYSLSVGGMLVAFIAFSRSYFDSSKLMPWVDKLLALLFYAGIVHLFALLFLPVESLMGPLMLLAGVTMLILLFIGPYAWWLGRQQLWVFALGNLCFISLCLLTHLSSLGVMPPATLIRHSYEFGMLAQSIFFAVGVSQKILSDRRGREKLAMQALLVKAEDKTKNEFLAKMSHEIRTPLNGLVGIAELLKSTKLNVEQQHYIDMLQSSGENLEVLLNDILDVSKMNAGQLKLDYCDVDFSEFLHKVSFPFEVSAESKGLALLLDYHPSLPAFVMIDPTRLRQVIGNLLSNAIKFTDSGMVTLSVWVTTDEQACLFFEVSDTGIGVAEGERERLFDSFQQGNSGIARRFGGSGLGLAICRQLIELMGGRIELSGSDNSGAKFHFWLPLLPCRLQQVPVRARKEKLSQIYPGKRALVAEDNIVNQQVICGLLQRYKISVDLVADGEQAVARVSSAVEAYDLIIMDCEMPIMDGFAAVQVIRALDGGHRHAIVALTAHVSSEYRQRCLSAGMDDYLTKPLHSEQLEVVLKKWLSKPASVPRSERVSQTQGKS
ncbi:signal transduction histidine kinase [Sinobacterium caligoides]|uniref:histidine kinase n=1 Tax=Sinobacterium caligoides TaxID=933926 RepID=A0A3N2DNM7_9GAMM|nr:hybrid sensor histidine kinase/response regulator [Sinobacterium caligoides]ROS01404.1 signal transduction histidine kinase [Sinobacterium caligoides]